MANLYSIQGWSTRYENSRTRTMAEMRWVPVPNKHDGEGFCALMERKDGTEVLGAWLLILQVASRCDPRGVLVQKHGEPHTPRTIARITRGSENAITTALDVLSHPPISWVIRACQEGDKDVTPAREGTDDGMEGNRTERNGMERKGRKRPTPGPQDVLARDLARLLGSSLNPCRKQIAALVAKGMTLDEIRPHLGHAIPGLAPWDWTKQVTTGGPARGLTPQDLFAEAKRLREMGQ